MHDIQFYAIIIVLTTLLINNTIVSQYELIFLVVEAQQGQNNATTTDMTNMRNSLIPQAQEVNEANSELIKICVSSPNSECDDTMIIIHNDCVAYPEYVATHIPSCDDSRLISYLISRELLQ